MKTFWCLIRSQKPNKKGAMVLLSPWQKFVWLELHHLGRRRPKMVEIGLMKQLGTMKGYHSEENVGEHLLSGVWNSEVQADGLSLGRSRRQQSECCKPPWIPRLRKGNT